jgi:type II secretory ATPase GspE/PulE/Tfp pilus assembly ATPase PilB-like protein
MQTITLKVKNDNDISLLMHLAERLGISIITNPKRSGKSLDNSDLFSILNNFRKKNELFSDIIDPVKWQKEIRKDKALLNRD